MIMFELAIILWFVVGFVVCYVGDRIRGSNKDTNEGS